MSGFLSSINVGATWSYLFLYFLFHSRQQVLDIHQLNEKEILGVSRCVIEILLIIYDMKVCDTILYVSLPFSSKEDGHISTRLLSGQKGGWGKGSGTQRQKSNLAKFDLSGPHPFGLLLRKPIYLNGLKSSKSLVQI